MLKPHPTQKTTRPDLPSYWGLDFSPKGKIPAALIQARKTYVLLELISAA